MGLQQILMASGGRRLTLTRTDFSEEIAGASAITFNSVNIGSAVPRLVIVGMNTNDAGSGTNPVISSATIDGGAATLVCNYGTPTQRQGSFIFAREMTTAGLVTIVANITGSMGRSRICVWTLTGYQSATAFGIMAPDGFNATSSSSTLNIPANGVVVACGGSEGSTFTYTDWATKTTEELNTIYDGSYYSSFFSDTTLPAATGRTFTYAGSVAARTSFCAASWQ